MLRYWNTVCRHTFIIYVSLEIVFQYAWQAKTKAKLVLGSFFQISLGVEVPGTPLEHREVPVTNSTLPSGPYSAFLWGTIGLFLPQ